LLLLASVVLIGCEGVGPAASDDALEADQLKSELHLTKGAVFTQTNNPAGNAVMVFARSADGTLIPVGPTPTGGLGSGDGLGSQGSVVLSDDGRWLLAVNAGSNEVSSFRVNGTQLTLVSHVSSNGTRPISVTMHRSLVYVLNAGAPENISGFTLSGSGQLAPLADSTRPLSGTGVGPAQVSFTPDGQALLVTEKDSNSISAYAVENNGGTTGPMVHNSYGETPFGFAFTGRGVAVISEAAGGAMAAGTASSYSVEPRRNGQIRLDLVSGSVPDYQAAPCWVVIAFDRYAYVSNTASNSVTSYRVSPNGKLNRLDAIAGYTGAGSAPADMALSQGDAYLYVLNGANDSFSVFAVEADGDLTFHQNLTGLPMTAVGVAAR
jgi:6-phosphogluconolactonase (cycloisomerase 2 family)